MTAFASQRRKAAASQSQRCYYCGLPMWEEDPEAFAKRHRLTLAQVSALRCTAEHLVARCEGGGNSTDNIVAAHFYCNSKRHARPQAMSPRDYRRHVVARMRAGRWLAAVLPREFTTRYLSD